LNFVGHAHFARRLDRAPRFVLGAMLPDLASMAGIRLGRQEEALLASGVKDHHLVDDVFHAAPTFCRLQAEAASELGERGLGWGSARAVAHVAPELFLDGLLLEEDATLDLYREAIEEGGRADTLAAIRFHAEGHTRFASLHRRLTSYGPPHGYRDPAFVGDVLVRILRERPRLALRPEDVPVLDDLLPRLQRRVLDAAPALLAEVAAGLG
jgi:hypothetical protein